jgi:hypothetical protein
MLSSRHRNLDYMKGEMGDDKKLSIFTTWIVGLDHKIFCKNANWISILAHKKKDKFYELVALN